MMKSNIAFLHSNNITLAHRIAQEVCVQMDIELYYVEDRAAILLNEEGPLKDKIIEEFGLNAYIDGKFNPDIVKGLNFSTSESLTRIQNLMNEAIVNELNETENEILVVSNEIVQTGLLHLSNNVIVAKFRTGEEYDEYISVESMKDVCSYFIEPKELDEMVYTLRGCLIDCWGYS
jgi:hypothetical protein